MTERATSAARPSDYGVRELTEGDVAALADAERDGVLVRPHKDSGGIDAMTEVLESLHSVHESESGRWLWKSRENNSESYSFEIRYARESETSSNRILSMQYVPTNPSSVDMLERRLSNYYTDSLMDQQSVGFLDATPGQYVAGASLALRFYTLLPIRNQQLQEWLTDPINSILGEMVGVQDDSQADADVVVQTMFRPAPRDWLQGVPNGQGVLSESDVSGQSVEFAIEGSPSVRDLTYQLRQKTYEKHMLWPRPLGWFSYEWIEHPPSQKAKDVAKLLEDQEGKAWELCFRIFAVSDTAEVARDRASKTAEMYKNFYEYKSEQTLIPQPFSARELSEELLAGARREFEETGITQTQLATAGLVNIPRAEHVSTNKMQWSLAKPGEGVPPGTPRFDYEAHGLTRGEASREEIQVAMLDASDGGESEPLWYGTGTKYGTEAGVYGDKLIHQFVGGETGMGKTTFLTNYAAQNYRGSGGGLVIDPKGVDADEFIAEWPDERDPEELIVMDLTDDFEEVPRFNFLEIPDYLEEGSRAHTSYCEALAEDIVAMVAEAGGSDKYMGALMKRIVKAVVRGLAKQDETATLLDVAAVCASSDNLSRFKQKMADNRFEFLRETAERLEQRDDTDLEPLAGRMDEWVLNDNVRELICARDSSFYIRDLIKNGRWLIVRCKEAGSEAEAAMLGTALIRRTYFAQRHIKPGHTFDLICDEFDNIASEESNIHKILSEARAFGYRCTLASQAPTNQFPDRVMNAIENQCGTFISFNPGGSKDARWISKQQTAEPEDLLNLPMYKFYMRSTTRENELTPSYMVEGFPPVREARADARTDEEIHALKQASLDIYGEPVQTEAELRAESPYIEGSVPTDEDGETADDTDGDDYAQRMACKAIYDTALREHGENDAWVAVADARERYERYTDAETTVSKFAAAIQRVAEVEFSDADGSKRLRCLTGAKKRFFPATGKQTEGGLSHHKLLMAAYDGLVMLGFEVQIQAQGGGAEVDGIGLLRESFAPTADPATNPGAYADEVQAFREEHPKLAELTGVQDATFEGESSTSGKPAATAENLLKAIEAGSLCIFLARPDDASKVHTTLTDHPFLNASPGEADRQFYNRKRIQVNGERPLRPAGAEQSVWREYDGEIVLEDSKGREHTRFGSVEAVFNDLDAYPAHTGMDSVDDEEIGKGKKWRPVAKPWVPEREFGGELPDEDAWRLLVVEQDGTLWDYETDEVLYGERADGDTPEPDTDADEDDEDGPESGSDDPWERLSERMGGRE